MARLHVGGSRVAGGPVPLTRLQEAVATVEPLPGGGTITYEPGGQLELSSAAGTLPEVLRLAEIDAIALGAALERAGLVPVGLGLDPVRPRRRVVDTPRYGAMEAYFDTGGPAGRTMMCGTAALQVSLDTGSPDEIERAGRAPTTSAPSSSRSFANSPLLEGRPSGWRSSRWGAWNRIDPGRTASVFEAGSGLSPGHQWARYALDAGVMLIRSDGDAATPVLDGLTFGEWIEHGHELGWPTIDDLTYHLSTLFPPVRPQGRFELRMIDALPDPWWRVAIAVTTALARRPRRRSRRRGRDRAAAEPVVRRRAARTRPTPTSRRRPAPASTPCSARSRGSASANRRPTCCRRSTRDSSTVVAHRPTTDSTSGPRPVARSRPSG